MKDIQTREPLRRIRSFIAVDLPVPAIQKVGELQSELRERARQAGLKVGWVPLTSMHVTLKFLAEIPEDAVWAVRDVLRARLAERQGFWLRLRAAGAFPTRQRPRVLWVGIDCEHDEMARLAGDVDSWLEELGFAREKRAFRPHLTLGRVKGGAADVLDGLEAVDFGECSVNEVVLYQSVLRRQGAEYTPLARVPLLRPPRREADADEAAAAPTTDAEAANTLVESPDEAIVDGEITNDDAGQDDLKHTPLDDTAGIRTNKETRWPPRSQ